MLTRIAYRRIGLVSGGFLGSNCRTSGPGVKRNLSLTGFWGGVEPQRVDRRQTGNYPVFVARSTLALHFRRLVLGGSPDMDGKQPYWPASAMADHVRPAALRAGITKRLGWR